MVLSIMSSRMACQAGYVAGNATCLEMCPNESQGMKMLAAPTLHTEYLLAAEDRAAALFESRNYESYRHNGLAGWERRLESAGHNKSTYCRDVRTDVTTGSKYATH